jgi:hypothetical protein
MGDKNKTENSVYTPEEEEILRTVKKHKKQNKQNRQKQHYLEELEELEDSGLVDSNTLNKLKRM